MNLPNYFLADLPPEATLSPAMLTEACQTLKRNREHYLAGRSTEQLVKVLSEVAEALAETGQYLPETGAGALARPKPIFPRKHSDAVWTIFSGKSRGTICTRCWSRNLVTPGVWTS